MKAGGWSLLLRDQWWMGPVLPILKLAVSGLFFNFVNPPIFSSFNFQGN